MLYEQMNNIKQYRRLCFIVIVQTDDNLGNSKMKPS